MRNRTGSPRLLSATLTTALAVIVIGYTLFPVLWMLNTSFKRRIDMISTPVVWVVSRPTLDSYVQAFVERPFLRYMLNSLIVAVTVTTVSMAFGTLAGYALARFRFPGTVKRHLSFGETAYATGRFGQGILVASVARDFDGRIGSPLHLRIEPAQAHVFNAASGARLGVAP